MLNLWKWIISPTFSLYNWLSLSRIAVSTFYLLPQVSICSLFKLYISALYLSESISILLLFSFLLLYLAVILLAENTKTSDKINSGNYNSWQKRITNLLYIKTCYLLNQKFGRRLRVDVILSICHSFDRPNTQHIQRPISSGL